jgi:NADPH-dependent curcumin reductase CurA
MADTLHESLRRFTSSIFTNRNRVLSEVTVEAEYKTDNLNLIIDQDQPQSVDRYRENLGGTETQ